jgi:hypothetical protein
LTVRRHRSRRHRPCRNPSRRHPSRFRRHLCSRCRQLTALRLQHPRPLTHRQRCRDLSPPLQIHRRHLHRLQRLRHRISHLLLCLRLRLRTPASTHRREHSTKLAGTCVDIVENTTIKRIFSSAGSVILNNPLVA